MPLLDFFSNPNVALAAGLLSPTPNKSFGQGLLQGIDAGQGARAVNTAEMLRQQQAQVKRKLLGDEQAFQQGLLNVPPSEFPLGVTPQNATQLNALSTFANTQREAQQGNPTRASLSLACARGDQEACAALEKMGTGGQNITIEGLFEKQREKTRGTNFAKAEATAVEDAGKVRAFEGATNELLRGLAAGAPVGTVASLIGTADVVRSQFNQALQSQAALEDQISGLSSDNQDEMRGLIARAIAGNEAASQTLSLVYLLASSRETGKLSDTDLKLSKDSIEDGSVEGMVTKLVTSRDGQIAQFNAKQKNNRERVGEHRAFAAMEGEKVFTVEGIRNAPDSVIQGFRNINAIALKKMLSGPEKEALIKRLKDMQNAN